MAEDKKPDRPCSQCGRMESEHMLANYADGPQIGAPFLVCPKAVFKPVRGSK